MTAIDYLIAAALLYVCALAIVAWAAYCEMALDDLEGDQ
jgi:hypothetical protein